MLVTLSKLELLSIVLEIFIGNKDMSLLLQPLMARHKHINDCLFILGKRNPYNMK